MVQWGLLNKDTVVGDSRAAAEWFRNVVTPRDKARVVESPDDLLIELLGAQAIATVRPKTFSSLISFTPVLNDFVSPCR